MPATAKDYVLDIPGTWNARDIGGRAIPKGQNEPLAKGVLLRSAALSGLDTPGIEKLEELNITTVLDLRGDDERARDGVDKVPASTTVHRLPFGAASLGNSNKGASADMNTMVKTFAEHADPASVGDKLMNSIYYGFIHDPQAHRSVGLALNALAEAPEATLVHCSAGKDRTGWIVALVQAVCDVQEADVMAEYLISANAARQLAAVMPAIDGVDPVIWGAFLTVKAEYIHTAYDQLAAEYGTLFGYLDAIGVPSEIRNTIRMRFSLPVSGLVES